MRESYQRNDRAAANRHPDPRLQRMKDGDEETHFQAGQGTQLHRDTGARHIPLYGHSDAPTQPNYNTRLQGRDNDRAGPSRRRDQLRPEYPAPRHEYAQPDPWRDGTRLQRDRPQDRIPRLRDPRGERSSYRWPTTPDPAKIPSNHVTPHDQKMAARQLEYENLSPTEQKLQDEWVKSQRISVCPYREPYRRVKGGYMCHGNSHFVTDELVAEGKGGIWFTMGAGVQKTPIFDVHNVRCHGPYYNFKPRKIRKESTCVVM